jgi:hypothetical protein
MLMHDGYFVGYKFRYDGGSVGYMVRREYDGETDPYMAGVAEGPSRCL